MAAKEIERKIAVIFATDVVGYSKLMEEDEEQTLKNLRSCRAILEGLFKEHDGRIFNTAGDSVLAEFSSAVSAVVCAAEFQRLIKERNDSAAPELRMEFRVGINMGDVVMEDGNLYGEGVNIAARLEALAQPNGICLSRSVHEFVNKKMDLLFNDLGVQQVKDNQFHAFDVVLDDSQQRKLKTAKSKSKAPLVAAVAAILILGIGGFLYINQQEPPQETKQAARDNLPIILVKPFKNLGGKDTSVSNALTESLISSLSRYKGIAVLSSSTSFHILEVKMPDKEIAESYGVKHTVQGSVQSFGKNTRLTVELNDLAKGKVVWSDKVDFLLEDIFKTQDEIGNKILGQLQIKAVVGEQAKQWMSEFETFEQYLLALNFQTEWRKFTKEGYENTLEIVEKLRTLNANQNVLDASEGWTVHQRLMMGFSKNRDEDLKRLKYLADSALKNRGNDRDRSLRAIVEIEHFSKDCDRSIQYLPKGLDLNNSPFVLVTAGFIHRVCGGYDKSVQYFRRALQFAPNDRGYLVTRMLVVALYNQGKTEEIKKFIKDKIDNQDMFGMVLWVYASMELEDGNPEKAKEYFDRGFANGARGKWILAFLRNQEAAERLTKALEPLGSLD